jgi:DNA-binding NarL/FixJ family response regulator
LALSSPPLVRQAGRNFRQEQPINSYSLVRILVVDDFAPWRRFVIAKLQQNQSFRIVGVVSDGLDAIQKAGELQPDVILLDIGLPKVTGIVAARKIRSVAPNSKILFLSGEFDLDVAQAALSAGGHGYLVKSDAENELFAAVEAVMRGKKFMSHRLASPAFPGYKDSSVVGALREEAIASAVASPSRCHEVQFYSNESLFLDRFTRFLGTALRAGNVGVFVGTVSHRTTLLERLHIEGKYVALDAAEFLSNCMVNNMPDTDRFLRSVDDLVVAARQGANGERLRLALCGECAHLLWTQGKADAAIRLEELWNQIAAAYDIDILCGYSVGSLRHEEDGYTFRRICEEHSRVYS